MTTSKLCILPAIALLAAANLSALSLYGGEPNPDSDQLVEDDQATPSESPSEPANSSDQSASLTDTPSSLSLRSGLDWLKAHQPGLLMNPVKDDEEETRIFNSDLTWTIFKRCKRCHLPRLLGKNEIFIDQTPKGSFIRNGIWQKAPIKVPVADNWLAVPFNRERKTIDVVFKEALIQKIPGLSIDSFLYEMQMPFMGLGRGKSAGIENFENIERNILLKTLHLGSIQYSFSEAFFEGLDKFPNLEELLVDDCPIGDGALRKMKNLKLLKSLAIFGRNKITSAGLDHLQYLENLEELILPACSQLDDSHLLGISKLKRLKRLDLSGCNCIFDAGLKAIAVMENLEELNLNRCEQISDSGIMHLAKLNNLRTLQLSGVDISDEGLELLAKSSSIERLNLSGCIKLTDAGLKFLESLQSLKHLDLRRIIISATTMRRPLNCKTSDYYGISCEGIKRFIASYPRDENGYSQVYVSAEGSALELGKHVTCPNWPFDAEEAERRQEETAKRLGIPIKKTITMEDGTPMDFVLIPAGEFVMGANYPKLPQPSESSPVYGAAFRNLCIGVIAGMILILLRRAYERSREKSENGQNKPFRIQYSLGYYTAMILCASLGVGGEVSRRDALNDLALYKEELVKHSAALAYYEKANFSEKPARRVKISKPFYLAETELTIRRYDSLFQCGNIFGNVEYDPDFDDSGLGYDPKPDLPAVCSARSCLEFCNKFSEKYGVSLRLPTEAEWEYACRAGCEDASYFSAESGALDNIAWHPGNSKRKARAGAQKEPNAWGLYDMLGNVWEICSDIYADAGYVNSTALDPAGKRFDIPSFEHATRCKCYDPVYPAMRGGAVIGGAGSRDDAPRPSVRIPQVHWGGGSSNGAGFRCVLEISDDDDSN